MSLDKIPDRTPPRSRFSAREVINVLDRHSWRTTEEIADECCTDILNVKAHLVSLCIEGIVAMNIRGHWRLHSVSLIPDRIKGDS